MKDTEGSERSYQRLRSFQQFKFSRGWRSNRSSSDDTIFGEKDSTLSYTLQEALVKMKKTRSEDVTVKNVVFGAVCDIKDSPYRIFKTMGKGTIRSKLRKEGSKVDGLFKPFEENILLRILEKFDLRLFARRSFTSLESIHNFMFAAADAGDLEEFQRLYLIDSSRLEYADARGKQAIHYATAKNRINVIKFIQEHGGDLDARDLSGNTALHYAVENNCLESLSALLAAGANSSITNKDQIGPIHLATQLDRVCILEEMVKHKGLVDTSLRGKHGRTALHIAAIMDHADCAKILLNELKCCPRIPCENGYYPIHEAARNASANALKAILEFGQTLGCTNRSMMSMLDSDGNVPLHSAVHAGDIMAVKLCLDSGAVISTQQHDLSTPCHLACAQGAIAIVQLMFESQPHEKAKCLAIKDAQSMTPLHHAAMFNHPELVEYLVNQGAKMENVDKEGRSVLLLAAARAAWKSVLVLIRLGADLKHNDCCSRNILHHIVISGGNLDKFTSSLEKDAIQSLTNQKDMFGCSPMHYASKDGHWKTIVSLINLGASINLKDLRNQSPLHFGCRYGRYNTVKLLLEGPEGHLIINAMDGEGMSPLHISSENGHTKVVQLLLVKGSLLQRDHRGRTPLHCAAARGYTKTMHQLVLVHSHLLDQCDREGNTPLHLSVINNQEGAASLLLSLNCKIKKNNQGMTAIDYALHFKHSEVALAMAMHPTRGEEIIRCETRKYSCLIEGLTVNMPDVMMAVLDKGITRSGEQSEDSKSYHVKYDFRCLESQNEKDSLHFLNLMIENKREELLSHPLCIKYLETKWSSYGMYFHLIILAFYTVFLGCLTANSIHISSVTPAMSPTRDSNAPFNVSMSDLIPDATLMDQNYPTYRIGSFSLMCLFSFIILLFSGLSVIKEFFLMYQQKSRYFYDVVPLIEWILYVSSLVMTFALLYPGLLSPETTHIVSAVAVFFAWFNYLLYLQRFNSFGIYIVMFLEILSTLLRVLFVFSVLIIAFGLSFFILLQKTGRDDKGFYSPGISMVRVSTMMLGEIDFLNTFLNPLRKSEGRIFDQMCASVWFLILFAILMPILLMNLLIGLAVGDIETVRRNASMKRLTMQVEHHTELERRLPRKLLTSVRKQEVFEYPNKKSTKSHILAIVQRFFASHSDVKKLPTNTWLSRNSTSAGETALIEELQKQKKRIREMSYNITQQLNLLRLIVQKMEIQTENLGECSEYECDREGDQMADPIPLGNVYQ